MSTPHPTDEELSAALDGEDPGAARHASGCETCSVRLEQLRAVAALVGAPVADVDDMARERAVRTALVPQASRPDRRPLVLGIAAAILLVLIAVPLALRDGNGDADTVASSATSDESAQVVGGDLGSLSDPQVLRARVAGGLGESSFSAGAGGALTGSGASAEDSAKSATTTTGGPVVAGAPQAVSRDDQSNTAGTPGGSGSATPPCAAVTKKTYGKGLGPLVYAATLTWQGTPSVVLGYSVPGANTSLDRRVFVMSRASCTLLLVFST